MTTDNPAERDFPDIVRQVQMAAEPIASLVTLDPPIQFNSVIR